MTDVGGSVRAWYGNPGYWSPQGKDAGWADWILIDQGALLEGKDVLNLGCFYPEDEMTFAPRARSWNAIDFTDEVIERARGMIPAVTFERMDMSVLHFPPESFDVVLDFSSGDHLQRADFRSTLAEVRRVLRPGGIFVVVFTNTVRMVEYDIWKPGQVEEHGRFGYSRGDTEDEMRAMLAEAGLEFVKAANTHLPRTGYLTRKP